MRTQHPSAAPRRAHHCPTTQPRAWAQKALLEAVGRQGPLPAVTLLLPLLPPSPASGRAADEDTLDRQQAALEAAALQLDSQEGVRFWTDYLKVRTT